ncbi:restriction endonuclease EcoRV [Terrimicrobium sacchariphilum]|uniref:Restriction endonuclease EcoRV n=1 Tax=Terrimicrobium sacchariphilum TaxID=690879 RepID=A0A146G3S4_TERSA|nr:type II restriction endonuclease [Terrimicrobium sacchariphilum]GAT32465.1 restriction endonuclease EcoRV [Terrimicrobium sacchariphilum]
MSPEEKAREKAAFKAALKEFASDLQHYVSSEDGQWAVKGFIDVFRNIYTITADTKIVSKILEVHLFPKILAFAEEHNLKVVLAEKQNWYPDFSFVGAADPEIKFAVDLKTTYRDPDRPGYVNGFTLGSHGEYFTNRSSTKNIQFPYKDYFGHFCLGAIYTRTVEEDLTGMEVYSVKELGSDPAAAEVPQKPLGGVLEEDDHKRRTFELKLKKVNRLQSIASVVRDFEFFACEKWELASDRAGSGNTANIGGIQSIEDIKTGNGVFVNLGEEIFDEYWMNHGKLKILKEGKEKAITKLDEYLIHRNLDVSLINRENARRRGRKRGQGALP